MNKKKIAFDASLNIIASAIPITILQLIVLPLVASHMGGIKYGLIITLISLQSLFSHPLGNVLNNVRLLQNNEYNENNIEGDFNYLLFVSLIVNSFIVIIGIVYYLQEFIIINIILIIISSGLNLLQEYLIVAFRINLNYKAILINNAILGVGYIFGAFLFIITEYWQIIFICGYSFSLIFIVKNSNLLKESFVKTTLFKKTTYKIILLFFAGFVRTFLVYADKLLLYPLLGPTAVSIYFSATVLGKIISMGITPLNSVMLSYLVKLNKIKLKTFFCIIFISSIVGILGYFVSILVSRPLLNVLYPNWADQSMKLIYITSATASIALMTSVINPLILRYNSINWQFIISITNLVIYIVCTFVLANLYGLTGFCLGILASNFIKFFLMFSIFVINYSTNDV